VASEEEGTTALTTTCFECLSALESGSNGHGQYATRHGASSRRAPVMQEPLLLLLLTGGVECSGAVMQCWLLCIQ
jgi:hypothetical protein